MNNWQSNVKYIGERMPYTLDCQLFIVHYSLFIIKFALLLHTIHRTILCQSDE